MTHVPAPPLQLQSKMRPGDFRMSFQNFINDHMLFKNEGDNPLTFAKTMLLHSPQPSTMYKFLESARPIVEEDIKKLSQ